MKIASLASKWLYWRLAGFILISCLAAGCISPEDRHSDLGKGPHDFQYRTGFSTLRTPSVETIKNVSSGSWRFNQPLEKVWKASLEVLSQDQGIVSMEKTSEGRTLCVIIGRNAQMSASDEIVDATFCSYYDLFLAIAVYEDSGQTAISVVALDPNSGSLRKVPAAEQTLFAQVQMQLTSAENWNEKFADINWQKRETRSVTTGRHDKSAVSPQEYETILGDWIGKRLRVELGVVNCPEVTQSLEVVVQRLERAVGITNAATVVHVLASQNINAFALPNGEIYVTSGLLDSAQSIDEIAAVLAHEISHLKNHDVSEKLRTQASGIAGANTLRFVWALAQLGMSVVPGGGLGAAIGQDIGTAAGSATVQSTSEYLEGGMVENFSEEVEIRADEDGCKALFAAGFNADADLSLLVNLKDKENNLKTQKIVAASNFVNMKPGLDKRILHMKKTLAELKANANEQK